MEKRNVETRTKFTCPICRTSPAENAEENFARCMKHANEGRGWALGQVGIYHYGGDDGVFQSFKKAFEYFSKAAELGEANSLNYLGGMYAKGEGVEQIL